LYRYASVRKPPAPARVQQDALDFLHGARGPAVTDADEARAEASAAPPANTHERRNTEDAVSDAKQRYLERKRKAAGG
jgi:hypothetical protein